MSAGACPECGAVVAAVIEFPGGEVRSAECGHKIDATIVQRGERA